MLIVSVDIETTGLDHETCQILQVGAVLEDTVNVKALADLPRFSCIVDHPIYSGQPVALTMNQGILSILASLERANKEERLAIRKEHRIIGEGLVAKSFWLWLTANGIVPNKESKSDQIQINVIGKNFGTFDKLFLERLPSWSTYIQANQRILDPAILFTDWKTDTKLPNLNECLKRANESGSVMHDALQDSIDVIRVLRAVTNNYEKRLF
jgi:hypothetical protein